MKSLRIAEPKTARERNEEFAKATKKIIFVTNLFDYLPVDDTPLADDDDDDDDEPLIHLPQKRRKPAKTKKTTKSKKPPKPKPRPTVQNAPPTSSATPSSAPKRTRNETNKVDDQLKRQHNLATIPIGPSHKHLNPLLLADPLFVQIMDDTLIHWQENANRIRKDVNVHLRSAYGGADMGDYTVSGLFPEHLPTTLINLISAISPTIILADKAEAKKFPSEVYSQVVKDLVGDLKSILINQFMRVLIIHVQRTLDEKYGWVVGGGIAKLVAAFLMGRKGVISQEEADDEIEVVDDEEEVVDEELESVESFIRLLNLRRTRKGVTYRDKSVLSGIIKLLDGQRTLEPLRSIYLPEYLIPLIGGWRGKISANGYATSVGLVWKLFAEVNKVEFVQHLFPTPSTRGRYTGITSTCLASIFTLYLKTKKESNSPLPAGLIPANQNPSILLSVWTRIPDLLWNIVFPGISDFVAQSRQRNHLLEFLHYAVMDAYSIKPLFAKLKSHTAKYNGGFNSKSWHSFRDSKDEVCFPSF